jgi:hypothetical protein
MLYFLLPLLLASTILATPLALVSRQSSQGQAIHFNNLQNKCLDVRGAVFANGTPVQIYDCNNTPAQRWVLSEGSTKVRLAGTEYCLDSGTRAADGIQLKIWHCYDNIPAQQWYYADDNRLELDNQDFCMDLDNGITTNGHKVQTWTCACNDNKNQVWTL